MPIYLRQTLHIKKPDVDNIWFFVSYGQTRIVIAISAAKPSLQPHRITHGEEQIGLIRQPYDIARMRAIGRNAEL